MFNNICIWSQGLDEGFETVNALLGEMEKQSYSGSPEKIPTIDVSRVDVTKLIKKNSYFIPAKTHCKFLKMKMYFRAQFMEFLNTLITKIKGNGV